MLYEKTYNPETPFTDKYKETVNKFKELIYKQYKDSVIASEMARTQCQTLGLMAKGKSVGDVELF